MVKPLVLLLLLVLISCVYSQRNYRLPTNVVPSSYKINLGFSEANLAATNDDYNGNIAITINVKEPISEIQLHSASTIRIVDNTIKLNDIEKNYIYDGVTEILTIMSDTNIEPGKYELVMSFIGTISQTDMFGIYRSSYQDQDGITKYLLATQFLPTYARRAFPCFDEPAFKATFSLLFTTFALPVSVNIRTNTKQTQNSAGTTYFAPTPIMSSYLVAFIISEFDCSPATIIDGVENSICSRKMTIEQRNWATNITPKILNALNQYTGINYNSTIDKLDQVAIPDFAAGGMENWGLVIYRETSLLYDSFESTNLDKQNIAMTLSHEIAHQWFGNLVTMQWWSELFLNEGFADYFENMATHLVLPNWQIDRQYVIKTVQKALRTDDGNALALQYDVSSPTEILLMFNSLTYSKGGSVIRMVEHIMGGGRFKEGLTKYLTTYKNGNTLPENLWASLQLHVNDMYSILPGNLNQIMENWIKQPGFPLLTVTVDNGEVTISQKQFTAKSSPTQWYVPISYTTSVEANKFQSTKPQEWLIPGVDLKFKISQNAQWIILNNLQTGYYRVNYDSNTWNAIEMALKEDNFSNIDELNRAGIVDDLFSLAKLDAIPYSRVFQLLDFLKHDVSYISWTPAFTGFSYLLDRVRLTPDLDRYISTHLLTNIAALYDSTPFDRIEPDDQIYSLKQTDALTFACNLGNKDCVQKATESFARYRETFVKPNQNLRKIIYCTALRESTNDTDWRFLWEKYTLALLSSEQALLLSSLACTKNETHLRELLEASLTESIRAQDKLSVFVYVLKNPYGIEVARSFLKENYDRISEQYQAVNSHFSILEILASKVTNQAELDEFEEFINTKLHEDLKEDGIRAVASAKTNVDWLVNYEADIRQYYEVPEPEPEPQTDAANFPSTHCFVVFLITCVTYFLL